MFGPALAPDWGVTSQMSQTQLRRTWSLNRSMFLSCLMALILLGTVVGFGASPWAMGWAVLGVAVTLGAITFQRKHQSDHALGLFIGFLVLYAPVMSVLLGSGAQLEWYAVSAVVILGRGLPEKSVPPRWVPIAMTVMVFLGTFMMTPSSDFSMMSWLAIVANGLMVFFVLAELLLMIQTVRSYARSDAELLRQARDAAQEAAMRRSKFVAELAHEMRTPLGGLLGLQKQALHSDGHEVRRIQRRGIAMVEHVLAVLEDIMDASGNVESRAKLEVQSFDVAKAIHEVVDMERARAELKGLRLHTHVDLDGSPFRLGDARKLKQVVLNLLNNAIKFTDSGEVVLEASAVGGDLVRFAVCDSGRGMTFEEKEDLFDGLDTGAGYTCGQFGGRGIGLTVTRRIIEDFGGRLEIHSEVGQGSVFAWTLDMVRSEPVTAAVVRSEEPLRVLVVDDEELNRRLTRRTVESLGHEVCVARCGQEALECAEREPFDLILMDLHMPDLSGLEVTKKLKAHFGDDLCPVVALTAAGSRQEIRACKQAGMVKHLLKPVRPETLHEAFQELGLHSVLSRQRHNKTQGFRAWSPRQSLSTIG